MHNKFLIFGENKVAYAGEGGYWGWNDENDVSYSWSTPLSGVPIYAEFKPLKVWTGSFNFTKNASNSFENVLILKDPNIVKAFYREWQHIMLFSEDLDWFSDRFNPDWKLTDP